MGLKKHEGKLIT